MIGTEPPEGARELTIEIGPLSRLELGDAIKELFRDIPGLGTIQDQVGTKADHRLFKVRTVSTDDELRDLFVFHVSKEQVQISDAAQPQSAAEPVVEPQAMVDEEAAMPPHNLPAEEAYGFFAGAPGSPDAQQNQE